MKRYSRWISGTTALAAAAGIGTTAVAANNTADDPEPQTARAYKLPDAQLRAPIESPAVQEVKDGIEAFWNELTSDGEIDCLEMMSDPDFDPVAAFSEVASYLPGQEEHFKTDVAPAGRVSYQQMCQEFKAGFYQAMWLQHSTGKKQVFAMEHGADVDYLKVEVREVSNAITVTLVFPAHPANEEGTLIGIRPMAK